MIKPIETLYDGCRFRSRLEARWAVLLNAIGAGWEYEPEGFKLGEAGRYLPDFLVKNVLPGPFWLEIKRERDDFQRAEIKAYALVAGTNIPLLMLAGHPETIGWGIVGSDGSFGSGGLWLEPFPIEPLMRMRRNTRGKSKTREYPVLGHRAVLAVCGKCKAPWVSIWEHEGACPHCGGNASEQTHSRVVSKALGARFEFGEEKYR
jgi:hypothetical protein